MKTLNDFQQKVWFINESEIKSTTLETFLKDFWKDESGYVVMNTSAILKAVVGSNNKVVGFCINDEEITPNLEKGESFKWTIKNGRGANYLFFETEQESYLAVLNKKYSLLESSLLNKVFYTEQEAIDFKN